MALQTFMNNLILSQGEISFDIVVVDDNARSLAQPKYSFAPKQQEKSIKNRWGGLVRQDSDPCVMSPKINIIDSSSKSAPNERRAPSKTKSDSTLAIPQRVASPSVLQTNRKRIRAKIKIFEDTSNSSSSSSCCQALPQLPFRAETPHALKGRKKISASTDNNRKSRSRTVSTVPALKLCTSKAQSNDGSIAILDDVLLMMEERPSPPVNKGFIKQDRYTKRSRSTQKRLPSRLLGFPYNTTIPKVRLESSQ